jgi:molybdopterin converting factor small subunit
VTGTVTVRVPRLLAPALGERHELQLPTPADATVRGVLDVLAAGHPTFDRRMRDDTGALRRHVNVYVDGEDVRRLDGLATATPAGSEVQVIQSVAGG